MVLWETDVDLNALKQQLQDRANLSPEQAEKAAEVALDFFKEHVPQIGGLLDRAGGADDIARRLGGLFGRRE
jgi:hypothetical protein